MAFNFESLNLGSKYHTLAVNGTNFYSLSKGKIKNFQVQCRTGVSFVTLTLNSHVDLNVNLTEKCKNMEYQYKKILSRYNDVNLPKLENSYALFIEWLIVVHNLLDSGTIAVDSNLANTNNEDNNTIRDYYVRKAYIKAIRLISNKLFNEN